MVMKVRESGYGIHECRAFSPLVIVVVASPILVAMVMVSYIMKE